MAQALTASIALIWEASTFQTLAERSPALRRNMLEVAARRLQELEDRYREISTEKVATRLSHQLLRLFNQLGRRVDGNGTLKINLSREELAQLTGTTLFTVSRQLSEWSARGVLTTGREYVSARKNYYGAPPRDLRRFRSMFGGRIRCVCEHLFHWPLRAK